MEYRSLGRTGVMVSPLCLGTMNFGGPTGEEGAISLAGRNTLCPHVIRLA